MNQLFGARRRLKGIRFRFFSTLLVAAVPAFAAATLGPLGGVLAARGASEFSGKLGGPSARFIDVRSPEDAFPDDTVVTISTFSLLDHGGTLCLGGVPGDGGAGVVLSVVAAPELQPAHPVFLTASYTDAEAASFAAPTSELALARFDPASGACEPLQTSFDTKTRTFLAQLNHFSLYQLVVAARFDLSQARIYPNPYRSLTDDNVTIDHIPPESHVRIFTQRGVKVLDTVADDNGTVTWATNDGGQYLVVIEIGGAKKTMKLTVYAK